MTTKTPVRATFSGSTVTGLAEYQTGEFIGVEHGGIGVVTLTSNAILLGNGTDGIQSSAIGISGTTLSSTDSSLITIAEGLTVTGTTTIQGDLNVTGTTTTINSSTIEVTNSFTFEGSTADDYETVLGVIDPTADRTINLPNASGTIVLQDTTDTLTNKTLTSPVIDTITNVGTLTLPTSTDTLVGRATTDTLTNKTLTSPTINAATFTGDVNFDSGTLFINASTNRVGVGSSTLYQPFTVHNTTSAQLHLRTANPGIRFSSDVAGNSDATRGFIGFATNNDAFIQGSAIGDLVLRGKSQGSIILGDSSGKYAKFVDGGNLLLEGSSITFEGSTPNTYETTLAVTDPTADRTITLPNATGTVVLKDTTDTLTNKTINLSDNTLTGTTAQFNSALSDGSFATLVGSETLTNKTINTANNTITIVEADISDLGSYITASSTDTLTNKTFDANGTGNSISNIEVADFAAGVLDTDLSSVSASDDTLASAKAIKTYIDTQVTAQDLDFQADSGGALSIDLDSESLTFTGGTGIDTTGSGNAVTFAIDSTVATLTGSQTLTNKTLTSPVLNTGVSGTAVLDEDNMASDSATQLATQQSIKAYVDTQVGAVSTSSISQGNSDVTVTDSGTGSITIDADGVTIITMNATTVLDASATTNAVRLPNGTTAQRPSGSVGMIRYNSSTDTIEGYTTAGGWAQLGATTATAENTSDTSTGSATAISTTASVIDQFVTSSFDSAWYLAVTRDEINDEVSTAKYSLVHNDTDAFVSESHITQSNVSNTYVTVTADVAGGNARLLGTGGSVVNSVSFYRIATGDNTSAGTTGNVTTAINLDVDSAAEKIDGFALASARGAKYYISVNNATTGEVSNTEALVVHDGSNAYISQYGNVNTGNNDLITLTTEIDSTEVILKASAQAPNCRVTVYRILLADDESSSTGDNVNVVEATTVDSGSTTVDSFATSAYTGAFYVFTGYNATEGAASIQEVMVLANDEAYVTQGPLVSTKGSDQLTFTASLSGTTVTVQAASTSGASTTVNGYRVHMLRGSAGASTADTVLVSTEQTITVAKTFTSPIALTVGSDPTGVADKAHIYAKDEASSAEVYVRDEAGNVTKISPHNEAGEWEYYSRNVRTGKTVRINMEEMIRDIEKLTGKTYIKND